MNVLYMMLRPRAGHVYGGEKSTIITAMGVAERGHDARFLLTAHDGIARELDSAGLSYEVLPVWDPLSGLRGASLATKARRLWEVARLNARVFRLVRGQRPALVHVSGVPAVFGSWAGAKLAGAALIFHVRDTSMARRTRWYEELAMMMADRTITISDSLRDLMVSTASRPLRPALARRVVTVYNGFDFRGMDDYLAGHDRASCRAELKVAPETVLAVMVGAFHDKKGQLRFLEEVLPGIVAAVPTFRAVLIGGVTNQAYFERCQQAVARLGLQAHVTFAGYQTQAEVYRWYRACDLALITSAREGLSRFAVEAQAFGLPVVSTRIVGPVDVIDDGQTGYLVAEDALPRMVEHVVALARDQPLRDRLGRLGAVRVREKFVLDRHHREIARVYADLARPPPAA
jgi:glycosyltransferase involved in cell wall biosynthesis